MQRITVNIDNAGSRLDKFLAKNGCGFAGLGFSLAQKLLRQKQIKVNSRKVVGDYKLQQGDEVEIYGNWQASDQVNSSPKISEEKLNLLKKSIIYQDANLIAMDKPSGIAVQSGNKNDFSIDVALPYLKFEKEETPRLVHRLDRDTSGVLLLARNRKTAALLTDAFKNKTINKTYLALVKGCLTKEIGTISIPLAEKTFGNSKKVFKSGGGKEAITHYKVLKNYDNYSLLELRPITGRMHQLRVHCKEIGHPIIGDSKYGKGSTDFGHEIGCHRLCLHSFAIEITDFFGEKLLITSKEPRFGIVI
jgi:23S rRNA pseudouridine955/2504/2580 synthase